MSNQDLQMQEEKRPAALSDEQRVKVLSPAMLVFKRFVRNKLAITGLIILLVMFVFSFVGGLFSPYGEAETFYKYDKALKEYASAIYNVELRYTQAPGMTFPAAAKSQAALAISKGNEQFSSGGISYNVIKEGEDFYRIEGFLPIADIVLRKGSVSMTAQEGQTIGAELEKAVADAVQSGAAEFEVGGVDYFIVQKDKLSSSLCTRQDVAIASMLVFDAFEKENVQTIGEYEFRLACERAIAADEKSFTVGGVTYDLAEEDGNVTVSLAGREFAAVSDIVVNTIASDAFLTVDFKNAVREAIADDAAYFQYPNEQGEDVRYDITRSNATYTVKHESVTLLINRYEFPCKAHPLGTDSNGMDLLTRLMYGGRVSLLVGFIVVFIELLIGVVMGGISGYFGGWVDTCIMRFVDLFNCIPYWPMMIIVGSILDANQVEPQIRIYLLMLVLGVLGWTGIARVVRGQILSLREQDFMVATEATGIRIKRRIFRHLVPNVMPLLIVQATMSLGSIIISEATLSFLGLGVKFPLASWGSIINAATNIYVMKNYWFIWVPAGILILLTVLGFNFVGDGLRDAFDPKMKR